MKPFIAFFCSCIFSLLHLDYELLFLCFVFRQFLIQVLQLLEHYSPVTVKYLQTCFSTAESLFQLIFHNSILCKLCLVGRELSL